MAQHEAASIQVPQYLSNTRRRPLGCLRTDPKPELLRCAVDLATISQSGLAPPKLVMPSTTSELQHSSRAEAGALPSSAEWMGQGTEHPRPWYLPT